MWNAARPVRRPGVVIIKTFAFLALSSRPLDTRYIQALIRLPIRTMLRLKEVTQASWGTGRGGVTAMPKQAA